FSAWLAAAPPAAGQQQWLEPPRLLNVDEIEQQIQASYPPAQRDGRVRGEVLLGFRVREDGGVDSASVSVRQASIPAFVEPARALVPRMRFAPAKIGGRPVAAWITHAVVFQIPLPSRAELREAPPDEGVYELSAVEELPALLNREAVARQIAAGFPPALRQSGTSAGVIVRFRSMEDGRVDPQSLSVELTADPAFDEAAFAVVRMMRFRPAKVNGRPVRTWISIPIQFQVPAPAPADSAGAPPPRPSGRVNP
ncbi:MAG TPA: TonB family protein, partial [Longimicrobium sp.]|nr:TonB family protein [Longimicrobium sp.]